MTGNLPYRLALDLGSTSLGWAMYRLDKNHNPVALIKAGVRIFPDGRNPKDGASLAVTRRLARSMRKRRDRLLMRKAQMMNLLIKLGFFPQDESARKEYENLNPYELRARGLDAALEPGEFARALFHINQRRGFKSNRKTDRKDSDSSVMKTALHGVRQALQVENCRTVGEWLHRRFERRQTVRARYRETPVIGEDGRQRKTKSYDLYIDRALTEAEFVALWAKQASLNPIIFNDDAMQQLKGCLLYQRPLRPVKPGRCTLLPDLERAPLALPSVQRARILQEVNHLRILQKSLDAVPLTLSQRDQVVKALETNGKRSFDQLRKLLNLTSDATFNLEDAKRKELKGNAVTVSLSKKDCFGGAWHNFSESLQSEIVTHLLNDENEGELVAWLIEHTGVSEEQAENICEAGLPDGYASLSMEAISLLLPELQREVITYDKAVQAAGFIHHSQLAHSASGEILPDLPYYGEYLQRHIGFGSGVLSDPPEKRFGKIANPTVHIGLNQIRKVVNELIQRYGHPSQVVIEVARELKQSKTQRDEEQKRQASNQHRNDEMRKIAAATLRIDETRVKRADIEKLILWHELSFDPADRRCPYSGVQIGLQMVLSPEVEIEHILPFSRTLDDSRNNKTVAMRQANRIKGNRTPWEARDDFEKQGWNYSGILERARQMSKHKRYRFSEAGYDTWLQGGVNGDGKDFLARALNDTRYMSRIALEYLSLICPQTTWAIPGQLTAMIRWQLGLNNVLSLTGEKNRNDHRHHAVDACVIGLLDRTLFQRMAAASAAARERQLERLTGEFPPPWASFLKDVQRVMQHVCVSHKPNHNYQGAMHNDTAYGLSDDGEVYFHKNIDGIRVREVASLKVIEISGNRVLARHGTREDGSPKPYKGYKGDSNYCIEIVRDENANWKGEVISTYMAYQLVRRHGIPEGERVLRNPRQGYSGKPLIMRLMINDCIRLELEGRLQTMRIATISANGQIFMAPMHEANVDARNRDKSDSFCYVSKMAGSLKKAKGRRITISPAGVLRDPGFRS